MSELWGGNRSLATTFWFFGVLGAVALASGFLFMVQMTDSIVIGALGFVIVWGWQVFAGVAIWRSAGKYEGRLALAVLARVAIIVGLVALGYGTGLLLGFV